ncbi:MAG: phospholipid carrier-dependent glycosyltransferase [Candidatus Omnitrophica bacterium]|nr:phospholipid carrier-dependent glycosyltransferase [Candidatus Omnitrophota bacterium]
MKLKRNLVFASAALVLLGIVLRFVNLRESGFFFYDEAFYLRHNLPVLEFINRINLQTWSDRFTALEHYLRSALASGKSLWFIAMDSRYLWGGLYDLMFPKVLAACFGVLALPLAYLFARRYYRSREVALLSVALMAILPGLVFYSRIGLQEALSVCLVLAGFYFYLFHRQPGWKTLAAGIFLAAAFFANYRLIVLPALVFCVELWEGLALKKGINWRRFVWFALTFFGCVVLVGNLFDAANTRVIFAWVFHQEDMAGASFSWVNLFSYPVYIFLMETPLFGAAFFAGVYLTLRKSREYALPIVLVLAQMLIFSLPSEKGARYLCVMLPFAVMSVAYFLLSAYSLLNDAQRKYWLGFTVVMVLFMLVKTVELASAHSDYEPAVQFIEEHVPGARILATQDQVLGLYVRPYSRVMPVPANFDKLVPLYAKGYRYLVIDPQAYVGLANGVRFRTDLRDYLAFIDRRMTPVKTFPHMNHAMLERFVFEHSENLVQSLCFLYSKDVERMSAIRIYDMTGVVPRMSELYLKLLKERK